MQVGFGVGVLGRAGMWGGDSSAGLGALQSTNVLGLAREDAGREDGGMEDGRRMQ